MYQFLEKAIIVQGTLEAMLLFDSQTRAWTITERNKLQARVNKCYRSVWNYHKGLTEDAANLNKHG